MRLPCASVMVTCVLLNVARILAMPEETFLACFALTIFLALTSSPKSSAAVGAAMVAGVSAIAAVAGEAGLPAASAAGFASFLGADFFLISSAIIAIPMIN